MILSLKCLYPLADFEWKLCCPKGNMSHLVFRAPNFIHKIHYNVINDALNTVDFVKFERILRGTCNEYIKI